SQSGATSPAWAFGGRNALPGSRAGTTGELSAIADGASCYPSPAIRGSAHRSPARAPAPACVRRCRKIPLRVWLSVRVRLGVTLAYRLASYRLSGVIVVVGGVLLGATRVTDSDVWTHLAHGR